MLMEHQYIEQKTCSHWGGGQSPRKVVGFLCLDCGLEGIPWYINATMTVFVPEGTSGYRQPLCYNLEFFIDNILCWLTCWAVLTWRQGLVSFPQKNTLATKEHHQTFKKPPYIYIYIYIKMQKYCDFNIFIYQIYPFD